jgi:hypothetical protein
MSHHQYLPLLIALFVIASPSQPAAKDCDCEQHSASASGRGTCSITEGADKCIITYEATENSDNALPKEAIEELRIRFEAQDIPVSATFRVLNETPPEELGLEAFRSILVNTIGLSTTDFDFAESLLAELSDRYQNFDGFYGEFRSNGCIETQTSQARYLLISRFSTLDGTCAR